MTYQQTLDYLFAQLPMYQRIGKAAYKANLDNTWWLMEQLNAPYKKFKSIHVAGTNGKGSTSHLLASIFQEAGFKTGLYTSPHLVDFRERIRINGEMISEQSVIEFTQNYKDTFANQGLSFFEWTVGLAFDHFAKENVDIAIVEVGLIAQM
jgi:dihydrofolate synthase / folylpolyglutamate synthase